MAGRPTKYKEEYAHMAEVVCAEAGFSVAKLAKLFKVNADTIHEWRKSYPEFGEAVREGKNRFDTIDIKDSLIKRAKGCITVETVEELNKNGELVIVKRITKEHPPDIASICYWLNNRGKEEIWQSVKAMEVRGKLSLEEALRQLREEDEETKS